MIYEFNTSETPALKQGGGKAKALIESTQAGFPVPDGKFSLIDVSVPNSKYLKPFYMFYLKNIIPILGRLFLGSPETYRMLGAYTEEFGNSKNVHRIFNKL